MNQQRGLAGMGPPEAMAGGKANPSALQWLGTDKIGMGYDINGIYWQIIQLGYDMNRCLIGFNGLRVDFWRYELDVCGQE